MPKSNKRRSTRLKAMRKETRKRQIRTPFIGPGNQDFDQLFARFRQLATTVREAEPFPRSRSGSVRSPTPSRSASTSRSSTRSGSRNRNGGGINVGHR